MVIAVPHRVILEHELAGDGRARIERCRGGAIEFLVAECPDGGRGVGAVALKELQRIFLGDALDRRPGGKRLRELDLNRIDARDVMDDDADLASVLWHSGLPL